MVVGCHSLSMCSGFEILLGTDCIDKRFHPAFSPRCAICVTRGVGRDRSRTAGGRRCLYRRWRYGLFPMPMLAPPTRGAFTCRVPKRSAPSQQHFFGRRPLSSKHETRPPRSPSPPRALHTQTTLTLTPALHARLDTSACIGHASRSAIACAQPL